MVLDEQTFWKYYNYKREDNGWDCKKQLSIKTKHEKGEFAKDVFAFSNYGGGYILIGVEDKTFNLFSINEEDKIDLSEIEETLYKNFGLSNMVQLLYFNTIYDGQKYTLGIMYIVPSRKVLLSPKVYNGNNDKAIIKDNIIYTRRGTQSTRANGEDIESIFKRLKYEYQEGNEYIINEKSALQKGRIKKFDFLEVLADNSEVNDEQIGNKLKEIWTFCSKCSKVEFAQRCGISPKDIEDVFNGLKPVNPDILRGIARQYNLQLDYFYRPTYNMRFAFWQEDLVKYAILKLVYPKKAISLIDKKGGFYFKVLYDLSLGISNFYQLIYGDKFKIIDTLDSTGQSKPWYFVEDIPTKLKEDVSHQYYKLLEQVKEETSRELMPHERILKSWFFASDKYIARLIIEGIDQIKVKAENDIEVNLRFYKDLQNKNVVFRGYDEKNLRMNK
ncbi:MAG: putative DNA binding domain-containing protein [Candidatus Zixiibacteriota bacterium]